jgi:hypothetical protein
MSTTTPIETAVADAKAQNLTGVLAEIPAVEKQVKAGYKTTEFWLTLVALALTNFSVIKIPGKYGQAIADAAAVAGYAISRGLAKRG